MDASFSILMNKLTTNYSIPEPSKYKSLTKTQIVFLIKKFMEKDQENHGEIKIEDLYDLLRNVIKFKCSEKEILLIVEDIRKNSEVKNSEQKEGDKMIKFIWFVEIVDILKKEKLLLVQLSNSLNYVIFVILMVLLIVYLAFFYRYN